MLLVTMPDWESPMYVILSPKPRLREAPSLFPGWRRLAKAKCKVNAGPWGFCSDMMHITSAHTVSSMATPNVQSPGKSAPTQCPQKNKRQMMDLSSDSHRVCKDSAQARRGAILPTSLPWVRGFSSRRATPSEHHQHGSPPGSAPFWKAPQHSPELPKHFHSSSPSGWEDRAHPSVHLRPQTPPNDAQFLWHLRFHLISSCGFCIPLHHTALCILTAKSMLMEGVPCLPPVSALPLTYHLMLLQKLGNRSLMIILGIFTNWQKSLHHHFLIIFLSPNKNTAIYWECIMCQPFSYYLIPYIIYIMSSPTQNGSLRKAQHDCGFH